MEKRKFNRRDFLRLSAAAATGAIVAACAPAAPQVIEVEKEVPVEKVVKETVVVEKEVVVEKVVTPIKLTFLSVNGSPEMRDFLEDTLMPAFEEEHAGVKVAVDYTTWGELDVKVMTAFAAGTAPDVFEADNVEFGPKYYEKGVLLEITPYIDQAPEEDIADFYPKSIEEGTTLGGKVVALPHLMDNRGFFYRKDLFEEAGLDPETPPENWDDLREMAIKLTKRDEAGEIVQAGWYNEPRGYCDQQFDQLLWQNGGRLFSETYDKCTFNSSEGVQALELWVELLREDKVAPLEGMPDVGEVGAFTGGTLAMKFSGAWELASMKKYYPEHYDDIGITVLAQKQKGALWYANCTFLTKGKHPDAAWELLAYMLVDRDNFAAFLSTNNHLPPRRSLVESLPYMDDVYRFLVNETMTCPGCHTTPNVPFSREVYDRLEEAIEKAAWGTATPKEALDTTAAEGDKIIERVGWKGWS